MVEHSPGSKWLAFEWPRPITLVVKRLDSFLFCSVLSWRMAIKLKYSQFNSLNISNMINAVGLTVSEVGSGQRSKGSGHKKNEIDYNSLKCNIIRLHTVLNLDYTKDLPWWRFAISECFLHCALSLAAQCIVISPVCGRVCNGRAGGACYHDNSKLRASSFTKLGL